MPVKSEKPRFFARPADFRAWLKLHHQNASELWVGFYKMGSGRPSITWPESVDEALCVGWIDGTRKRLGDDSYKIRFTPRRQGSIWSVINIKRCQTLTNEGRVLAAGLKAFQARKENKSGIYAYEQRRDQLEEPYASKFKKNKSAWAFFQAQPPSYRKKVGWWIISAKQKATRLKRLQKVMELSARRERA